MKIGGRWMSCASLALLLAGSAVAGIKTWQVGSGNWSDGANWAGGVPVAGDDVVITNASANVLLAASTPALTSLTLSGKLVCTNWSTSLQAQSVSVATGGLITLPNAFSETQMSNRVWIVCSNDGW